MKISAVVRVFLRPLSLIYGVVVRFRAWLYAQGWFEQRRLKGVVISVGNITVGGTGKTPMVIWLAERFLAEGRRVAILSRGYRGSDGTSDEIELMKERLEGRALFGVGKDRFEEGLRLESEGVEIFILDDGFQHMQLARDVDIVLIDATRPLREQLLLPAGRLREPVSAINRADLVVFTRTNHVLSTMWADEGASKPRSFPSRTKLVGFRRYGTDGRMSVLPEESVAPLYAFCGIGNPDGFLLDLQKWGLPLAGHRTFRDHYRYNLVDAEALEASALEAGARALVTTEKDAHNLVNARFSCLPVYLAVISLEIPDDKEFFSLVKSKLPAPRGEAA